MSAKRAAEALVQFDTTLRESIEKLDSLGDYWWITEEGIEAAAAVIREVSATWTLSLAAASAGVTEVQVLCALGQRHLHMGTQVAAGGMVRQILAAK